MKLHLALAASIATLALAGCGDTSSRTTKVTPKPPPTEKIKSPDAEFDERNKLESTTTAPPGGAGPGAKPAPRNPG